MEQELVEAINEASHWLTIGNDSLRQAMMELDCDERERHQMMAARAAFRLSRIMRRHPAIQIANLEEFWADLALVTDATRDRRMELFGRLT